MYMMISKTLQIFLIIIGCIIILKIIINVFHILKRSRFEAFSQPSYTKSWYEYIDVIYYINLDHRKDRQEEFLGEMEKMGVPSEKVVRIPAIYKPGQGDLGCSLSHLSTIQKFIDSGLSNCIIFEDDFEFTQDLEATNKTVSKFFDSNVPYNICMLSSNTVDSAPTDWPFLLKINSAQTTSGYLVSNAFAPILRGNYQEGSRLLEESYTSGKGDNIQGPFCIDQYWKRLQGGDSQWYVFDPKLGKQRDSYSDIQGGVVHMTV
jgi:Glycosyltransferase family 25 (LPS biosynthesis protein)